MVVALFHVGVHAQQLPPKPAAVASAATVSFVVPPGVFAAAGRSAVAESPTSATRPALLAAPFVPSPPMIQKVLLYASATTRMFMATGGIDAAENIRTWEVFLRKYRIPFQILSSVEQLEKAQPGVLLLPSAVALSEREKQAVAGFRANGGGILATWLAGVRDERGEWRGFGFMHDALDVTVAGSTEADQNDIFMMPNGDSPVAHHLPAGFRIWLQRVSPWYPLRLMGGQSAAHILSWSRTVTGGKPSTTMSFDERVQPSGRLSRSVVFGYSERLWLSADPKATEALAHNALMWLLRQPDAYVSAWPHPYRSAFMLGIDGLELFTDSDLSFARQYEAVGGRATYYLLGETANSSKEILKKIQAQGHQLAFMGDRFAGFKDQATAEQNKRLEGMQRSLKDAGIDMATGTGFSAPMELADKTTEKLLEERGFGHFVAPMDRSEARLPFFASVEPNLSKGATPLIGLPRTQGGPDDEERDPATGLRDFFSEIDLVQKMSGLAVVKMSNQSALEPAQIAEFFKQLKQRSTGTWFATGGQLADWWRARARVDVRIEPAVGAVLLNVSIRAGAALSQPVAIWVNLPESRGSVRLLTMGASTKMPKIVAVDAWRTAIVLDGFEAGEYQWQLYFDQPAALR